MYAPVLLCESGRHAVTREKRLRKFVDRGSELKSESRRVWVKGREVRVVLEGKGLGVSEREKSHGSWGGYEAGLNDKAGVVWGGVNPFPLAYVYSKRRSKRHGLWDTGRRICASSIGHTIPRRVGCQE